MKRRRFLQLLAGTAAAVVAGVELATRSKPEPTWVMNPEWVRLNREFPLYYYEIARAYEPLDPNAKVVVLYTKQVVGENSLLSRHFQRCLTS